MSCWFLYIKSSLSSRDKFHSSSGVGNTNHRNKAGKEPRDTPSTSQQEGEPWCGAHLDFLSTSRNGVFHFDHQVLEQIFFHKDISVIDALSFHPREINGVGSLSGNSPAHGVSHCRGLSRVPTQGWPSQCPLVFSVEARPRCRRHKQWTTSTSSVPLKGGVQIGGPSGRVECPSGGQAASALSCRPPPPPPREKQRREVVLAY